MTINKLAVVMLMFAATMAVAPVSVQVSPTSATVPIPTYVEVQNSINKTKQFTAKVSGSSDQNVSWKLCVGATCFDAGVSSQYGVISSSGLYTAPQIFPNPAAVTVVATAQHERASPGTASITVDRGMTWTTTNSAKTGPCPFAEILSKKGTDFDCHYTISSDNVERDVRIRVGTLFVPGNGGVIHFHGSGNTWNPRICANATQGGNWMQNADRHHIVVMCPHGLGACPTGVKTNCVQGWWSWWFGPGTVTQWSDDSGFVWAMLTDMVTQFGVNPDNRHTVGISGGANLQTRLAIEDGALLGSVGWVDGSDRNFDSLDTLCGRDCAGRKLPPLNYPVSVMIVRGNCPKGRGRCRLNPPVGDALPFCSQNSHSATMQEDFDYYAAQLRTGIPIPNGNSYCPHGRGGEESAESYKRAIGGRSGAEIWTYVLSNSHHQWYANQDISVSTPGAVHNAQLRIDFPQATPNDSCTSKFCTGYEQDIFWDFFNNHRKVSLPSGLQ